MVARGKNKLVSEYGLTPFPHSLADRRRRSKDQHGGSELPKLDARPFGNTLTGMKAYQEFAIDYYQDEDGMFTARVPAIKGCIAWGKTLEETYRHTVDAIESCLEAREKVAALKLRKPRYAGLNIYARPVNA